MPLDPLLLLLLPAPPVLELDMFARAVAAVVASYRFRSMPYADALSTLRYMGLSVEMAEAVVSYALMYGTLEGDGEMLRFPRLIATELTGVELAEHFGLDVLARVLVAVGGQILLWGESERVDA